jgi:Ca2+-binding EF-hand superfamily protein
MAPKKAAQPKVAKLTDEDLRELFQALSGNSGVIRQRAFRRALQSLGIQVDEDEAAELLYLFSADEQAALSYEDFAKLVRSTLKL